MATIKFNDFVKMGGGTPQDITTVTKEVTPNYSIPREETGYHPLNDFVKGVASSFDRRGQNVINDVKESYDVGTNPNIPVGEGVLKHLSTAGHIAGNVAGGALDIIGSGISSVTPQPIKSALSKGVQSISDEFMSKDSLYTKGINKYTQTVDEGSDVEKSIGDIINTGSLYASEKLKPKTKTSKITEEFKKGGDVSNTIDMHDTLIKFGDYPSEMVYKDIVKKIYQPDVAKQIVNDAIQNFKSAGLDKIASEYQKTFGDFTNVTPSQILNNANNLISSGTGVPAVMGDLKSKITGASTDISKNIPKTKISIQEWAVDSLEKDYTDWAGGTKKGFKDIGKAEGRTEALNNSGTQGKTPQRILAEAKIIPETRGTKFSTLDQANNFRESLAPLQDAADDAIKNVSSQTPPLKIDSLQSSTIANISKLDIPVGDKIALINDAKTEYSNLKSIYGDSINLENLNNEKKNWWKGTKFDLNRPFKSTTNYQVAKTAQQAIEFTSKQAGFDDVAQLNREIGDRLEASKFLEKMDGNTIKYGQLGKYVLMGIGASAGKGLLGKIGGAIGGELVAQVLIDTSVSSPVKRLILKSMQIKDPEAYSRTVEWLKQQNVEQQNRLGLPAAGESNASIPLHSPGILEGQQKLREGQSLPADLSSPQAIKNANMVNNIDPNTTMSGNIGQQDKSPLRMTSTELENLQNSQQGKDNTATVGNISDNLISGAKKFGNDVVGGVKKVGEDIISGGKKLAIDTKNAIYSPFYNADIKDILSRGESMTNNDFLQQEVDRQKKGLPPPQILNFAAKVRTMKDGVVSATKDLVGKSAWAGGYDPNDAGSSLPKPYVPPPDSRKPNSYEEKPGNNQSSDVIFIRGITPSGVKYSGSYSNKALSNRPVNMALDIGIDSFATGLAGALTKDEATEVLAHVKKNAELFKVDDGKIWYNYSSIPFAITSNDQSGSITLDTKNPNFDPHSTQPFVPFREKK